MSKRSSRRTCEICGVKEAHLDSPRFFANFPLEETRCREWVRVTGNEDLVHIPIEKLHCNKHICDSHFKKTHINKNRSRLKKRAVPCLNLSSAPLTEVQMSGFPLHLWKNRVLESDEKASTSTAAQDSAIEKDIVLPISADIATVSQQQEISVSESDQKASTSTASQDSAIEKDIVLPISADIATVSQQQEISVPVSGECTLRMKNSSGGVKRKLTEDAELTPRKKKLVERLKKTQCTLKSLKKSAILIEKIKSPVLKELVVNTCKNEKRKPKGRRWTTKHKLSCLAILKRSPKTYRYLSAAMTLPSIKTLQNILKKVPMTPGINQSVLNHLKMIAETKDPKDRICNLAFDEMALKSRVIFNEGSDIVEGFEDLGELGRSSELADHALVFLLQGLRQKFKQPIAFYLTKGTISSTNLAQIIKKIINEVTACGFTVVHTVCDQGPTNMGALRLLREASGPAEDGSNHYFKVDGQRIFIVYDIPHLFKSLRNNFLKAGYVYMDGIKGKWEHLVDVEKLNRSFLYLSKITLAHVQPKYRQKMRVKLAAQALSNTVSAVLKLISRAESGEKAQDLLSTAQVVGKLDHLFDISNGPSGPNDVKKGKRQNVSAKSKHMEEWANLIKTLSNTKFMSHTGIELKNVKCVEGYIISLKSLRDIWWTTKKLGLKYLNLRNLNQDALENLFGVIRQHSPTNRNPTASHFMMALKTAVVTGLTAPHSRGANCEKDDKTLLTDFHNFIFDTPNTTIDQDDVTPLMDRSSDENIEIEVNCEDNYLVLPEDEEECHDFSLLSEQPTVYISGYLAKQMLKKINCERCEQNFTVKSPGDNPMFSYIFLREWWQNKMSLTYPTQKLCESIKSIVDITEKDLLPQLHKANICLLGCTLYDVSCPTSCFDCDIHGSDLKFECFKTTCKLLIRRQCKRINQGLASKEEDLASVIKRAEQQGKAK